MYNIWNAAVYEITNILIDFNAKWEMNPWVKAIRLHCFFDWVAWKTERTMKKVDQQIKEIQDGWAKEDYETYVKPIIKEHKPNSSEAQQVLGGTLEIKAPWYQPEAKD